jgi:hypothetical protein
MPLAVDFERQIQFIRDRVNEETNPKYKAMWALWQEHLEAEADLDLDRTMATVSPDAAFHSWGGVYNIEGPRVNDFERVKAQYKMVMDSGGFPPLELVCERFFIGEDALLVEGDNKSIISGADAQAYGFPGDPDRRYVAYSRLCCWVPFKDGLILAEDLYWHPPYRFELLAESEV